MKKALFFIFFIMNYVVFCTDSNAVESKGNEPVSSFIKEVLLPIIVTVVAGLIVFLFTKQKNQSKQEKKGNNKIKNTNNNSTVINNNVNLSTDSESKITKQDIYDPERIQKLTKILFIDDDTKFQIVSILKTAGWTNTSIVKDIKSLDIPQIINTHIFFVDINGVGKRLNLKDEGLGLVIALKDKYPNKKIVIYSSEAIGDRFHEAFRRADAALNKFADTYQFLQILDQFTKDLFERGLL